MASDAEKRALLASLGVPPDNIDECLEMERYIRDIERAAERRGMERAINAVTEELEYSDIRDRVVRRLERLRDKETDG